VSGSAQASSHELPVQVHESAEPMAGSSLQGLQSCRGIALEFGFYRWKLWIPVQLSVPWLDMRLGAAPVPEMEAHYLT
jgi:hypothetical protein